MSFKAGSISVDLRAPTDAFVRAMRRAADSINGIPGAASRAAGALAPLAAKFQKARQEGEKWSALGSSMTSIGGVLAGVGVAAAAVGVSITNTTAGVEANLANAAAIAGKTEENFTSSFDAMRDSTIEVAASTKYTAGQISEAFGSLALAGYNATAAVDTMPAVTKLATAANVGLADSAETVVNIMKGYGKGAEDLDDVNNTLVAGFTSATTNLMELKDAFKFVGPVASGAGVSFEETTAALGLLANSGQRAAIGGTGLRTVIAKVAAVSEGSGKKLSVAEKAMHGLGLTSEVLAKGGLAGVTQALANARQKAIDNKDAMGFVTLAYKAFGSRGAAAALAMAKNAEQFREMTEAIEAGKDSKIADFIERKQLDTFSGAVTILKSSLESLSLSIGQLLLPYLRKMVEALKSVLSFINHASPSTKKLIAVLTIGAIAFATLGGAIGSVLMVVGMALPGLATLAGVLGTTLVGAIGAVVGAIGTVLLAIGVFIAAYKIASEVVRFFGGGLPENVSLLSVLGSVFEQVTGSIQGFMIVLLDVITTVVSLLAKATGLSLIIPGVDDAIGSLHDRLAEFINQTASGPQSIEKTGNAVADFGAKAGDAGDDLDPLQELLDGIAGGFNDVDDAAKRAKKALEEFYKAKAKLAGEAEASGLPSELRGITSAVMKHDQAKLDLWKNAASAGKKNGKLNIDSAMLTGAFDDVDKIMMNELVDSLRGVDVEHFAQALKYAREQAEAAGLDMKEFDKRVSAIADWKKAEEMTPAIGSLWAAPGMVESGLKKSALEGGLAETFGTASAAASNELHELADAASTAGKSVGDLLTGSGSPLRKLLNGVTSGAGIRMAGPQRDELMGVYGSAIDSAIGGGNIDFGKVIGSTIGAAAPAIGTVAGGAIGSMVGAAVSDMLSKAGDALSSALSAMFADSRISGAIETALTVGWLAFTATMVAAAATVMMPWIGLLFAPLMAGIGAVVGMFLALTMSTKSYERFQGALTVVIDKVVKSLEPFWTRMLSFVGLFEVGLGVLQPFFDAFMQAEAPFQILFYVLRTVGQLFGWLGFIVAAVYDGLLWLTGALAYAFTWIMTLGDTAKAQDAMDSTIGDAMINLDDLGAAIEALGNLTWDEAKAMGEAAAHLWDLQQAADGLNGELTNVPQGIKVAAARFRSISVEGGAPPAANQNNNGGGAPPSGPIYHITIADLTVQSDDKDALIREVVDAAERNAFRNTGTTGTVDFSHRGKR